jgi:hypothetical protein
VVPSSSIMAGYLKLATRTSGGGGGGTEKEKGGLWTINLDEDPAEGGAVGSRLDGIAWRPEA